MAFRTRHAQKHPLWMTLSAVMVLVALTACGDADDEESTPTADVATVESVTGTPVAEEDDEAEGSADLVAVGTPTAMEQVVSSPSNGVVDLTEGSPDAEQDGASESATPTPEIVVSAPPVTVPTEPPAAIATPEDPDGATPVAEEDGLVGDGTGGPPLSIPDEDEGDSSDEGAEEAASDTVVDSCSVETFPPFTGDSQEQVTTADVNFRNGPGTDCELIFDQPLGEGATVEVISDPVTREGEPEFTWVAIAIDGTVGWVVTDFVEPAA